MFSLAVAAALAASSLASAQINRREKLEANYIDAGNLYGELTLATERTAIGPVVTIDCPAAATCTVQADRFLQVGQDFQTGDEVTIGFYIDGLNNGDEQQACEPLADGLFTVCAVSEYQQAVTPGTHTVQPYAYSTLGTARVFNYNSNFRVYTP